MDYAKRYPNNLPIALNSGVAIAWNTFPIGFETTWPGIISSIPTNWALEGGQALNRATYSVLFSILNTIHGAGDGINTFNLPNKLNRFPIYAGCDISCKPQAYIQGSYQQSGGNEQHGHSINGTHYHYVSNLSHSHYVSMSVSGSTSGHSHSVNISVSGYTSGHSHSYSNYTGTESGDTYVDSSINNAYVAGCGHCHSFSGSTDSSCDYFSGSSSGSSDTSCDYFSGSGDAYTDSQLGSGCTDSSSVGSTDNGYNIPPFYAEVPIIKVL